MIQKETLIQITDNSGALLAKCIETYKKPTATLGDIVLISIQKLNPKRGGLNKKKIKKGELFYCLIVRVKKEKSRKDGSFISFKENAGILLNKQKNPIASRAFGVTSQEVRKTSIKAASLFSKII